VGLKECKENGSGYGQCAWGNCKNGYNKDNDAHECVPNECEPGSVQACTDGYGSGNKTCNSKGSAYGACELDGCQQGYRLDHGVCVAQACVPGSETVCDVENGTGLKVCNQDGTDYGSCNLSGCNKGHSLNNNGKCVAHKCEPASKDVCRGPSGSGLMYCWENGQGHGECELDSCDEGYKLKNKQCVSNDSCDQGETFACAANNGTGLKSCGPNGKISGTCVINACDLGYELTTQGNTAACKKQK
jgi:hypothetical protein